VTRRRNTRAGADRALARDQLDTQETAGGPLEAEGFAGELVLAAIERAECHNGAPGVVWSDITAHLGLTGGLVATSWVRERLNQLIAEHAVRKSQVGGARAYDLTVEGRRSLTRARRTGTLAALSEAPQHVRWREAYEAARENIDGLQRQLKALLPQAQENLDSESGGEAVSWAKLALQMSGQCAALAWATYCLNEWPEPLDNTRDLPQHAHRERIGIDSIPSPT
jgi:hypothetical protein